MYTNGYNAGGMASTKPLISLVIDEELLARLDEFRWAYRLSSRGAAIRYLIEAALDQNPVPDPLLHGPADPTSVDYVKPGRRPQKPILPTVTETAEYIAEQRKQRRP